MMEQPYHRLYNCIMHLLIAAQYICGVGVGAFAIILFIKQSYGGAILNLSAAIIALLSIIYNKNHEI